MPIHELPPSVIAQISAGEVITRAGDVVKELVENAIDAVLTTMGERTAGRTIEVAIREGGHSSIQVSDDGIGIPEADLPRAILRHATSKITSADDLQRLASLGFRGEALAAICAVADLEIVSATADGVGSWLEVRDGDARAVRPQARRTGTSVSVSDLFERLPARRKYQRAVSAETAYIGQLVQGYALAFPEIGWTLICDGRTVLRTPGSGDVRDAAAAIFGVEAARDLLTVRDERPLTDDTLPLAAVTGLIGPPSLHRATRNGIFLTVNRRPVESRSLVFALEDAYATQMPVGRHPLAIIDVMVPPHEVDANVHPTKREVRLLRDRLVFSVLQRVVRATLVQAIGIPRLGETRGQLVSDGPIIRDDEVEVPLPFDSADAYSPDDRIRPRLGGLRILGQVALTYIICEGRAGLYLVDQHAAHERVILERLEEDIGRNDRVQYLLDPSVVSLPRSLRGAADSYIEALTGLGFAAEMFGDGDVVVRAIPAALRSQDLERVLRETHEALDEEGAGPDWRQRLALLFSCKTAVKAGQRLETAEMQSLLDQLDEASLCATCSHGRPTAILLSHSQLEREFGRR